MSLALAPPSGVTSLLQSNEHDGFRIPVPTRYHKTVESGFAD
jgi:hypothetical protein